MIESSTGSETLASARVALLAWIEARVYVAAAFVVTHAVINRLQPPPDFAPVSDGLLAWDGRWYETIAASGYLNADDPAVRFFPLWPLLGRAVANLPGIDAGAALIILANVLALAAGTLIHVLVLDETGDEILASRTVRLLALAPPSFVLVLAYSEALYLCLAIAVFLLADRQRWWLAAAVGFLAGLTRPVAVLLAPALALAAWQNRWLDRSDDVERPWVTRRARGPAANIAATAAVLSPLAGAATFVVWAGSALGDRFAPFERQRELRGDFAEPVSRMVRAAWRGIHGDTGELLHFMAAVALVTLAVYAVTVVSRPLALYGALSVVALISAQNLNSLERYAIAAFPLVIAAAIASDHPWLERWVLNASSAAMACLTILALHGVYVP